MAAVQNEAKLREAIVAAIRHIREEAQTRLPEKGNFEPLRVRFAGASLVKGAGDVEFNIGSASRKSEERERFLELKVFTSSGGSESSAWVAYGSAADIRQALKDEASLIVKLRATLLEGVQSLLRHELP